MQKEEELALLNRKLQEVQEENIKYIEIANELEERTQRVVIANSELAEKQSEIESSQRLIAYLQSVEADLKGQLHQSKY